MLSSLSLAFRERNSYIACVLFLVLLICLKRSTNIHRNHNVCSSDLVKLTTFIFLLARERERERERERQRERKDREREGQRE